MKGIWGRALFVNLTDGAVKEMPIPEEVMRRFLGGVGIGGHYLISLAPQGGNPLGPDNPLVVAPGLLTGSPIPTASKTVFCFKSPQTGFFGRSVAGARLGVELKRAGYDALIIMGKSTKPVVLVVEGEEARLEDAADLWGLDVFAVREALAGKYPGFRTAVIGPAGEKLSRIAGIDCDGRQAGRAGGGAVMGTKLLKAVVVKGSKVPDYACFEALEGLAKKWNETIRDHPATVADMGYGTGEFLDWMNRESGTFPSRNWQWGYFVSAYERTTDKIELDPYYWVPKYSKRNVACPGCTKPCGKLFVVEEGKYAGLEVDGPEYETLYSLGGAPEIASIEAVAKANEICDRLGIDTISAGLTLSWAMEALERGYLTAADLDGIELRFGDEDAFLAALEKLGRKEGKIGELLGDGVKAACARLGKGEEFAIHIKGLELPAYDIRGAKGVALAFAVSYRGGCHLTACAYGPEYGGAWWKFERVDRHSCKGKGAFIKLLEDLMAVYDILGICKFSRHIFFLEGLPEMVEAATGLELTGAELLAVGERLINLARAFNVREGLTRADDQVPPRVVRDPIPKGPSVGDRVSEEELHAMLDDYYAARGWSRDGVPLKAVLVSLDLPELVDLGSGKVG
jgi:aldehyde:ferredoxin oxidoreductase